MLKVKKKKKLLYIIMNLKSFNWDDPMMHQIYFLKMVTFNMYHTKLSFPEVNAMVMSSHCHEAIVASQI